MNRRRDQPRTPVTVIIGWVCCVMLCIFGGTRYVSIKNRQIQTQRQIERIHQDIRKLGYEISGDNTRMEELLRHVNMSESLKMNRSALQPISAEAVEEVAPAAGANPRRSVAAAAP